MGLSPQAVLGFSFDRRCSTLIHQGLTVRRLQVLRPISYSSPPNLPPISPGVSRGKGDTPDSRHLQVLGRNSLVDIETRALQLS